MCGKCEAASRSIDGLLGRARALAQLIADAPDPARRQWFQAQHADILRQIAHARKAYTNLERYEHGGPWRARVQASRSKPDERQGRLL